MKYICMVCGEPTDNDQSFDISVNLQVYHYEVHRCDKCKKRLDQEFDWESEGETTREDELICPYCGYAYDDYYTYQFDEGKTPEVECAECGRKFDLEIEVRRMFSTKRSICEMPENYGEEDEEE